MRRRTVLTALATATTVSAGCIVDDGYLADDRSPDDGRADPTPEEGSVLGHFDGGPTRPACEVESEVVEVERDGETREFETAATIPYPEPPETSAESAIVDYVEAFEEAYVTHDELCDRRGNHHILDIGFSVKTGETLDRYEERTTVFLLRAGGATAGVDPDGAVWVADLAFEGVVYAVDESGAARAEYDGSYTYDRVEYKSRAPDPLEVGEPVAAFDRS